MTCNKISKPEFTKEFILENCGTTEHPLCKYASKQIKFCQLFGHIQEHGKIIVPDRNIQYPSKLQMAKNFTKAGVKHMLSGFKKRSKEEQKKCMAICRKNECNAFVEKTRLGPRCKLCGCCTSLAKRWQTKHCPVKKW